MQLDHGSFVDLLEKRGQHQLLLLLLDVALQCLVRACLCCVLGLRVTLLCSTLLA